MSRSSSALLLALVAVAGVARAERPLQAISADLRSLSAEIEILRRKTESLTRSVAERRSQARQRLRLLYKLSQGGYLRLVAGADTLKQMYVRRDGVGRVTRRDLAELQALSDELTQLETEKIRLRERERRVSELEAQNIHPEGAPPSFPAIGHADASLPVPGHVVALFGVGRDPVSKLEISRDGVELRTTAGEPVRAIAAGEVRFVGPLPGLGLCLILDHGNGWASLLAHLRNPRVIARSLVAGGTILAEAAGPTVQVQITQGGTWIDPLPWIGRGPRALSHPGDTSRGANEFPASPSRSSPSEHRIVRPPQRRHGELLDGQAGNSSAPREASRIQ